MKICIQLKNEIWCSLWTYIHVTELKVENNSTMTYYCDPWCHIWYQRWPNPPKLQLGIIRILQVWWCSWCTSNCTRQLPFGIQLNNDILCWFMMITLILNMTQSSKTPVSNHQCPPSMTVFLKCLYLCYIAENRQTTLELQNMMIHDVKNCPIFQVFNQEPSTFPL